MGLGLYGVNPSPYKLSVIDSEGSPDQARRGVEKIVKEDHVIAVIGSLLSKTANAVAAVSSPIASDRDEYPPLISMPSVRAWHRREECRNQFAA